MDQLLHGLSGVMCYLDDIIVNGAHDQEHLSNLVFWVDFVLVFFIEEVPLHSSCSGVLGALMHRGCT